MAWDSPELSQCTGGDPSLRLQPSNRADDKVVSGTRIFLQVDKTGVHVTEVKGHRIKCVEQTDTAKTYFNHAAMFIECTNLQKLSSSGFGTSICITYHTFHAGKRIKKYVFGFVISLNMEGLVYCTYQSTVCPDPLTRLLLPSYMLLRVELMTHISPEQFLGGSFMEHGTIFLGQEQSIEGRLYPCHLSQSSRGTIYFFSEDQQKSASEKNG